MSRAFLLLAAALFGCSNASGGNPADPLRLAGPQGFDVTSTALLSTPIGCGSGVLPSGMLDGVTVFLGDQSVSPLACNAADAGSSDAGLSRLVQIQIASAGYLSTSPPAANVPLMTSFPYPILNEGVSDEDLCGNVPGGMAAPVAIVTYGVCDPSAGCTTSYWAVAGSVTLSALSTTHIEGTLDVTLGNEGGDVGGKLSGTFSADLCPGG